MNVKRSFISRSCAPTPWLGLRRTAFDLVVWLKYLQSVEMVLSANRGSLGLVVGIKLHLRVHNFLGVQAVRGTPQLGVWLL